MKIDYTKNNNSRIIDRLTFKAELAYDTNLNVATSKAEEVLKLVKEDTQNELKANVYKFLYKCYKAQNKYSRSLQMHEKHLTYNDSLQIEKNNITIIKEAIQNEHAQAHLKLNQLKKSTPFF